LCQAGVLLCDRGQGYDKNQERSMARIVAVFNALTGLSLSESDGWTFMVILKMVRSRQSLTPHKDSLLDMTAYTALLAECELNRDSTTVESGEVKQCK
jgi:hypothetical protein